jgi:Zn-dependent protease
MLTTILVIFLVAVPAIVLHECAHGWAAYKLGDPTARQLGRLTLNPLKHVDPVGTLLVPGLLYFIHAMGWTHSLIMFGWAKPVPVNFSMLRNPRRDMALVGAAGPLVNLLIVLCLVPFLRFGIFPQLSPIFFWGVMLNLSLAFFNLLPIPPLDGSRIVMPLLPYQAARAYLKLEPFGIFIVLIGVQLGWLDFLHPLIIGTLKLLGV